MSRFLRPAWAAFFVLGFSLIFAACTGDPGPAGPQGERGEQGPTGGGAMADAMVHSEGSNTWIVGGHGDNFTYDGTTYLSVEGFVTIDVNDDTNDGIVVAQWDVQDRKYDDSKPAANGTVKVVWTEFAGAVGFMDGGIASNLTLHGDSGQEALVLPTVYTYSAGWGTADIYLNDDMIYQDVSAHYMVTNGTRDPVTHEVHSSDGTGLFVPKPKGGDSGDGFIYPNRLLTHVVVHTQEQDPNNFPPWSMFMHINYENTSISAVARP